MSRFVPVAQVADVPEGTGRKVRVEGLDLVVFNLDGEFHVFEDFCKEGADLSKAVVSDEGDLLCPYHGWKFDVREGVCAMVPDCQVRHFPVKVEEGRILADLGLPA